MTQAIASHYDVAQQRVRDGKWRVDTDLGLVYGVKGQPFRRVNSWGYVQIKFRRAEDYRREMAVLAHRVIWEYANGPLMPELQINHINGFKLDNRLVNLEAVTGTQNMRHAADTGLMPYQRPNAQLTEDRVREIYRRCWSGGRDADIALEFGVSRSAVNNIRNGWAWVDVTGHVSVMGTHVRPHRRR